jgi:hypothetical protein
VQYAFGIPGNDVLELIRACEERGIRFVLAKSEPSAAFMADAVYHLTRRPAALIAALGPGLANAVSGIAGAEQERTPLIVLTGEAATPLAGIYTHQVFDHVALARPVTKHAAMLNAQRPAQHVAKALDIALAYPPGPVMLNVPADQSRAAATDEPPARPVRRAGVELGQDHAERLRALVAGAQRPLALVGLGALHGGRTRRRSRVPARLGHAVPHELQGQGHPRRARSLGPRRRRPEPDRRRREPAPRRRGRLPRAHRLRPDRTARRVAERLGRGQALHRHRLGHARSPHVPAAEEAFGDLPAILARVSRDAARRPAGRRRGSTITVAPSPTSYAPAIPTGPSARPRCSPPWTPASGKTGR